MNSKKWFKRLFFTTLIVVILPVSVVVGFNYYIDPLWNFSHKNEFNDYQIGFDERQQKTNYINSHKQFEYEGLLIGTSRVTYMDANKFDKQNVFNYSLSSLHIDEYLPYIEYATKKNGKDFDTIYMELYVNSYDGNIKPQSKLPATYIEKAEDPFYKYTSLFSYSTLKSSINNFKASKNDHYSGPRSYNRDNVAQTTYPNDRITALADSFQTSFNSKAKIPYTYNEEYKAKLLELKNAYPNTKFVVFTDPIPEKRFELIINNEHHREAYERWFHDMIDVFGEVYSFQGYTPINTNMEYFFDLFHYYPKVGDMMINAIEEPNKHEEILTIVNDNNIKDYLSQLSNR